jgi:hypothetical protein
MVVHKDLSRKKFRLNRCCSKPRRGSFSPIPPPRFRALLCVVPLPTAVRASLVASLKVLGTS